MDCESGLKDWNRSKRLEELRWSCSPTLVEQIGVCQRFCQRISAFQNKELSNSISPPAEPGIYRIELIARSRQYLEASSFLLRSRAVALIFPRRECRNCLLQGSELALWYAADRTYPTVRNFVKWSAGSNTSCRISLGRIIDVPADRADVFSGTEILLHSLAAAFVRADLMRPERIRPARRGRQMFPPGEAL